MHATRADISNCKDGPSSELSLYVEVPLLLIWRQVCAEGHAVTQTGAPDAVVEDVIRRALGGLILRRQRGSQAKEGIRKTHRAVWELVIVKWRVEVVCGRVRARGNGIVENSETRADRRLLIAKWGPSQTNPRIDVLPIRAGLKDVTDRRESPVSIRRVQKRVK